MLSDRRERGDGEEPCCCCVSRRAWDEVITAVFWALGQEDDSLFDDLKQGRGSHSLDRLVRLLARRSHEALRPNSTSRAIETQGDRACLFPDCIAKKSGGRGGQSRCETCYPVGLHVGNVAEPLRPPKSGFEAVFIRCAADRQKLCPRARKAGGFVKCHVAACSVCSLKVRCAYLHERYAINQPRHKLWEGESRARAEPENRPNICCHTNHHTGHT